VTRAIIFANGEMSSYDGVPGRLRPDDLVIAADGGLRHLELLGVTPHVVVGDLDSTSQDLFASAERGRAQILRHPASKDQTDLELALEVARERGAAETVVFGALGGRPDHAIANILLLAASEPEVCFMDATYEVFAVRDRLHLLGDPGDAVTLLALGGRVTGIRTEGLEYPLKGEALDVGTTRGVSNVMVSETAGISMKSGRLLVIHLIGGT
jgi:thiamine pyrophosphokinase